MAIGSPNRRLGREEDFHDTRGRGNVADDLSVERNFVMEHHGKFLKGTSEHLLRTTKEDGTRMAMVACLLVVSPRCF